MDTIINKIKAFLNKKITLEEPVLTSDPKGVKPKTSDIEIERKFLMRGFPDDRLFLIEGSLVHQAYLSTEPEISISSRVYEDGTSDYKQTIKDEGILKRNAIQMELTEKQFDSILKLVDKSPIEKIFRVYILEDGTKIEVNHIDKSFYYGKIEFETEAQAKKWKPTEILKEYTAKEITFDSAFKTKNYWKRTRLGIADDLADIPGVMAENEFIVAQENLRNEEDEKEILKRVKEFNRSDELSDELAEEFNKLIE